MSTGKEIKLVRDSHNQYGTFGELTVDRLVLQTVEQDWEDNQPNISCIPNGTYKVTYHKSGRHGDSYILENEDLNVGKYKGAARRFGCLIHAANLASQLEGCIAPGLFRSYYKEQWSVSSSGASMDRLIDVLGKDPEVVHSLEITSEFPTFTEA